MKNSKAVEAVEAVVVAAPVVEAKATTKKAEVVQVGEKLAWNFASGKGCEISLDDLSPAVLRLAALHGLKQTISDAYSGEKDAAIAHALAQVRVDTLKGGDWTKKREGGNDALHSDFIQALCELNDKPLADVVALVNSLDKEKVKAIKAMPKVAAKMAAIKADRLTKLAESDGAIDLMALFAPAVTV
jgi:hypothetical protein